MTVCLQHPGDKLQLVSYSAFASQTKDHNPNCNELRRKNDDQKDNKQRPESINAE